MKSERLPCPVATTAPRLDVSFVGSTDPRAVSYCLVEQTSATQYTPLGQIATSSDALGHSTNYAYDDFQRQASVTDANLAVTSYAYYSDGALESVKDPDNNTTTYTRDALDRVTEETTPLGSTYTTYDGGNVSEVVDADNRTTQYTYDRFNNVVGEYWYAAGVTPATDRSNAYTTLGYTYDADGEMLTATESAVSDDSMYPTAVAAYSFTYNGLGEIVSVDNDGSGASGNTGTAGVPDVVLAATYDANGNRTQLFASGGNEFVNDYSYDALNRETSVVQHLFEVYVDPKTVNFGYNADGQFTSIDRFNSRTNPPMARVATTTYGYDSFGRTTSLTTTDGDSTTSIAAYAWSYDAAGDVKSFTNSATIADYSDENIAAYGYDATGQLTSATPTSGTAANAANSLANVYDANGNATGQTVGAGTASTLAVTTGNTLTSDGTYNDTFDAEGNLTEQSNSGEDITYTYDNRNELTSVVDQVLRDGSWVKSYEIDYRYDMFQNLIGRTATTYETDGVTVANTSTERYVYDGNNAVFAFNGSDQLTDRYLWGPAVDQLLADENYTYPSSTAPFPDTQTLWTLGDNQNTIRDVINDSGTLEQHIAYSPFGARVQIASSYTNSSLPTGAIQVFGYTGAFTDAITGDQLHGVRWYNPQLQRWMTQDPSGLGPDSDPYRYCGNGPTYVMDPSGFDDGINIDGSSTNGSGNGSSVGYATVDGKGIHYYSTSGAPATPPTSPAPLQGGKDVTLPLVAGIDAFEKLLQLATDDEFAKIREKLGAVGMLFDGGTWDIPMFKQAGETGRLFQQDTPTKLSHCEGTVTVQAGPKKYVHWAAEVNYILWGRFWRVEWDRNKARYRNRNPDGTDAGQMSEDEFFQQYVVQPIYGWRGLMHGDRALEGRTDTPSRRSSGLGIAGRVNWARIGFTRVWDISKFAIDGTRSDDTRACIPSNQDFTDRLDFLLGDQLNLSVSYNGKSVKIVTSKFGERNVPLK